MLSCASLKGIVTLSHVLQLSVSCPHPTALPTLCRLWSVFPLVTMRPNQADRSTAFAFVPLRFPA